MKINISPKEFTIKVNAITIHTMGYQINKEAEFVVQYLKEDGSAFEIDRVFITGDEFAAWGADDNYIVDLVLSKLGLEKA